MRCFVMRALCSSATKSRSDSRAALGRELHLDGRSKDLAQLAKLYEVPEQEEQKSNHTLMLNIRRHKDNRFSVDPFSVGGFVKGGEVLLIGHRNDLFPVGFQGKGHLYDFGHLYGLRGGLFHHITP